MTNYISETFEFSHEPTALLQEFGDESYCYLLESSLRDKQRGRYSFFGCDPFDVYEHKACGDLDALRQKFDEYRFTSNDAMPFSAGIVGFLAYDHGLYQEGVLATDTKEGSLPDCLFAFYDWGILIDHQAGTATMFSTGYPHKDTVSRSEHAQKRLQWIRQRLMDMTVEDSFVDEAPAWDQHHELPWVGNFTKEAYEQAVAKALAYIADGDIYQVNLSQRFSLPHHGNPRPKKLFTLLQKYSPTHFGGYFDGGHFQVVSSSPERYLQLRGREVLTQPMKGTRPRGKDLNEDQRLRDEIIASGKDQSELLMITDLERNDLGRVCDFGSVKVVDQRSIEEYATVFQAISSIKGNLREDCDAFDLLKACFPGGSITGCPKIRAMQIIEELEPTRRSLYTGAMGYMSYNGNMDMNILIRTVIVDQEHYHLQVGGGIVAESTPEGEHAETLVKAKAMKACVSAIHAASTKEHVQS